jgi:hypothetical protein
MFFSFNVNLFPSILVYCCGFNVMFRSCMCFCLLPCWVMLDFVQFSFEINQYTGGKDTKLKTKENIEMSNNFFIFFLSKNCYENNCLNSLTILIYIYIFFGFQKLFSETICQMPC